MITILILGLVLRLINLNQSLWLDEAVSVLLARDLSLVQLIKHFRSADFHPPLHYFFLHFWGRIFGWSEISMRLPSVLFGIGTIWVVYEIAKLFTSEANPPPRCLHISPWRCKFSTVAALFMATAPFHIYYSQEARPYAMATFLASISMWSFVKMFTNQSPENSPRGCLQNSPPGWKLIYLLSTTALLYTDYYGFLILLSQMVIILIRKKYSLLFHCFVVLLFFAPWLPVFLAQFQSGFQATQALPEWGSLVNLGFLKVLTITFDKFSIGRITIFNKKLYAFLAGILFLIYGGIIGRVISDQWSVIRKRKKLNTDCWCLVTILSWLFIPISLAWLISFFIPNYQPFRLLLVLPAFYLLLAFGCLQIRSAGSMFQYIRPLLIGLVLAVNLVSLGIYYFNPYFHREDWRGAVQFIEGQENAVAILPSVTSDWPWRYYSSGKTKLVSVSSEIKPINQEDFNSLAIEQLSNRSIYFIRYLVPLFDPQERIDFWLKEQAFVKIGEISFNQIPVWEYK
jgi:uncharacterized membrane protein